MSEKIQFPNNRLTPASLGKPVFATDIQNLTENLLEAMNILLGLPADGFAILSGFVYASSAYGPGYVYMNGVIYYCAGLAETKYLAPDPTDTESKLHNPDGNSYNTYRIYYAIESNSPVGGMPQFSGDMNQYRLDLTTINTTIEWTTWQNLTLLNGWTGGDLQYRKNGQGLVYLKSTAEIGGGTGVIATLPSTYRPITRIRIPVCSYSYGPGYYSQMFTINTNGNIELDAMYPNPYIAQFFEFTTSFFNA